MSKWALILYRIKTDGSNRVKISDDNAFQCIVSDNWLYYSKIDDNKIYKIKTDGSSKINVVNDVVTFNINGNWIYYSNANDKDSLYRIKTDGTEKSKLSDYKIENGFDIVEDGIYNEIYIRDDFKGLIKLVRVKK